MRRCDNNSRSLGTKFKVVTAINFLSRIGDNMREYVIRRDKMCEDVITIQQVWVLNLKLSLRLTFCQG